MNGKKLWIETLENATLVKRDEYRKVEKVFLNAAEPEKSRLDRVLKTLSEEIDKLLHEIAELQIRQVYEQSESEGLSNFLQGFIKQLGDMHSAYFRVSWSRAWKFLQNAQTPEEVITEVLKIPKGQCMYEVLDEFAAHLTTVTTNNQLIQGLQMWGERRIGTAGWTALLNDVNAQRRKLKEQTQPALLVKISREDEASTQSQSEEYSIKAWLVENIEQYRDRRQGFRAINSIGNVEKEGYVKMQELHLKLPIVIAKYLVESSLYFDKEPEVHIWLPLELMNHDVDCWELSDGYWRVRQKLGHEYRVIFRCAERLRESYRPASKWRTKWRQLQYLLDQIPSAAFITGDDGDLDTLSQDFNEAEDPKVGVKIRKAPTHVGSDSLFGFLLDEGIPLAIWGRKNLTQAINEAELDRVLSACFLKASPNILKLKYLPDTVKQERRRSQACSAESHIGHHLSLLWDDPSLVPPKSK